MDARIWYGITGASGAVVGGATTYFIVNGRLKRKYEALTEAEIQSVKDTFKLLRKEPPFDDPATAVEAYLDREDELHEAATAAALAAEYQAVDDVIEAVENLGEVEEAVSDYAERYPDEVPIADPVDEKTALHNIFEAARNHATPPEGITIVRHDPDEFDLLSARDPEHPYVISTDLFMDDENEFEKITLTYFEGDSTLADEKEQIIPNAEKFIGDSTNLKFGNFSDSADTVYIRNEAERTDYEVVREEGSYATVVLGMHEMDDARARRLRRKTDDEE